MYHGTFHGTRSGVFGLKILYRHNKKELCLSTNYAKEVELVFFQKNFLMKIIRVTSACQNLTRQKFLDRKDDFLKTDMYEAPISGHSGFIEKNNHLVSMEHFYRV